MTNHTRTHSFIHSLSLSLTHTHSHTHTHTHTHNKKVAPVNRGIKVRLGQVSYISKFLGCFQTHTHTHTLTRTHSHAHTHTHTHTRTRKSIVSCPSFTCSIA